MLWYNGLKICSEEEEEEGDGEEEEGDGITKCA